MKYRKLSESGDYTLGRGEFLSDSPETVAQAVKTRFDLYKGEWFLDTTDGTDYYGAILGSKNKREYDFEILDRITGTTGLKSILYYNSILPDTRELSVTANIETIYGNGQVTL